MLVLPPRGEKKITGIWGRGHRGVLSNRSLLPHLPVSELGHSLPSPLRFCFRRSDPWQVAGTWGTVEPGGPRSAAAEQASLC